MLPKAAAIDAAIANGVRRVHVISYKMADSILLEVFHQRRHGNTRRRRHCGADTRGTGAGLNEPALGKGACRSIERVLRYTAGEDHKLDARLVPYDVRGSIAHAEMLAAQSLIDARDCAAICDGLRRTRGDSFSADDWQITLEDEDVPYRIGIAPDRCHRRGRRPPAPRPLPQRPGADRIAIVPEATLPAISPAVSMRYALRCMALPADTQGDVDLPGYTHMQHAMPSSVALWCGGFAEGFW